MRRLKELDDFSDFDFFLYWQYKLAPGDVEVAPVPGHWRCKAPCPGISGGCRHPDHALPLLRGSMTHTIVFLDQRRDLDGRFQSQYQTWREYRLKLTLPRTRRRFVN